MKFVDEVKVQVRAGNGGAGAVSWNREKFRPKGGPCGGNGGCGGAVIFYTDSGLNTLIDYSFSPELSAEHGEPGSSNLKDGASGADLLCPVPVGTQVFYNDQLVADLKVNGARWVAARGGVGGKGNAHFKSATNQAPAYAQPGQPGEEFSFRLILKSIADVGLVGIPNVGKSTLIATITKSHPKIADYPFTTLVPHLGVVVRPDGKNFVIADIPGLIPGAHEGKGLGITFLKHVERTKILLQVLDLTQDAVLMQCPEPEEHDIMLAARKQFEALDKELSLFSADLGQIPRIIAISKIDLSVNRQAVTLMASYFAERGLKLYAFSSTTGEGVAEIVHVLADKIKMLVNLTTS